MTMKDKQLLKLQIYEWDFFLKVNMWAASYSLFCELWNRSFFCMLFLCFLLLPVYALETVTCLFPSTQWIQNCSKMTPIQLKWFKNCLFSSFLKIHDTVIFKLTMAIFCKNYDCSPTYRSSISKFHQSTWSITLLHENIEIQNNFLKTMSKLPKRNN